VALTDAGRQLLTEPRVAVLPVGHRLAGREQITEADLASDQVCLAVAASRTSPVVDDFFTAAQATAEITAECGNCDLWQLGSGAVSKHG
jgi:DNA-binding transcriptional LysR family regulator